MSLTYSKFLSQIIQESFGLTVRQTADPLIQHGPLTLSHIGIKSVVPLRVIKECLQILIQHNLVSYSIRPKSGDAVYQVDPTSVISLINYSRFCQKAHQAFGRDGKLIMATVLRSGRITLSKLMFLLGTYQFDEVLKTTAQSSEVIRKYFNLFEKMVKRRLVIRCVKIITPPTADVPEFGSDDLDDSFAIPNICFKTVAKAAIRDDIKLSEISNEDDNILWKLNIEQFSAEMKVDILTDAVEQNTLEPDVAAVFKTILSLGFEINPYSDSTPSVSFPDIEQAVRALPSSDEILPCLDDCLKILTLDSLGIVTKIGSINGGQFVINVKEGFRVVTIAMVEKIVESRFGSSAARLFRIIRRTGYMEQDKLTQKAMMSTKLGRFTLYKLVDANIVSIKEIRKTYTIASSLTNKVVAFAFYVDFDAILRSLLEEAYQTTINARVRLKTEKEKHKRLLEKEFKIDKILYNMKKANCTDAQLEEVKDMLTYPERKILSRVHQMISQLIAAQFLAHRTIFIINTYFDYHQSHRP